MKDTESAQQVIKKYHLYLSSYDGHSIGGKQIKVEMQDDTKRRKDSK
jgi:hypothetical protein